MQAATLLAEAGNHVTLCEQSGRLGGQVRLAAEVLPDYGDIVSYLDRSLRELGVDVRLETTVTASMVDEHVPKRRHRRHGRPRHVVLAHRRGHRAARRVRCLRTVPGDLGRRHGGRPGWRLPSAVMRRSTCSTTAPTCM